MPCSLYVAITILTAVLGRIRVNVYLLVCYYTRYVFFAYIVCLFFDLSLTSWFVVFLEETRKITDM